jgi:hypothetical protein
MRGYLDFWLGSTDLAPNGRSWVFGRIIALLGVGLRSDVLDLLDPVRVLFR